MSKQLKIAIAGCGAIGSSLAKVIVLELSDRAVLSGLYDIDSSRAADLAVKLGNRRLAFSTLIPLIKKADLLIEATHPDAVWEIAKSTLSYSKDIMLMSVGGILNHYDALKALAKNKKAHMYIPSGAICGIDGLKAVTSGKINKVTLTTRKHPRALSISSLENIKEDTVVFEGDVESAIKAFPQNINVAATLSLAGIGPKNTVVRILACPNIDRNIHEVEIESDSGRILTRTENIPHPENPKTSYLAVLSAIATVKQILEPIKVGT